MKKSIFLLLASWTMLSFTGCSSTGSNLPLMFGQSHTLGISLSSTAANQGVDLSLGYKDQDVAVVPVAVTVGEEQKKNEKSQESQIKEIYSTVRGPGNRDALSVLGQFSVNTSAGSEGTKVGLGKFFATGLAAQKLSDGFCAALGGKCNEDESQPDNKPSTSVTGTGSVDNK